MLSSEVPVCEVSTSVNCEQSTSFQSMKPVRVPVTGCAG